MLRLNSLLSLILWIGLVFVAACPKTPPKNLQTNSKTIPDDGTQAVGVFYRLQAGETLWAVASRYGVDVNELLETNGIDDPRKIKAGRLIFIPDVDPMAPTPTANSTEKQAKIPESKALAHAFGKGQARLSWPVKEGVLYSGFGVRQGIRHDGIDLGAPAGTPVLAASAGEVIYVGFDRAFGNLVILRHDQRLVTVYAHNRDVKVHIGQKVSQGQVIAHVGASGRSQGPHLHFEVRQGKQAKDPLDYLPAD